MLVASGVLVWVALSARTPERATEGRGGVATNPPAAAYQVGDRVGAMPELEPVATDTLLLYLRSGCPYCTESMGFYRKLQARESGVRLVAAGPEPRNVLEGYLNSHGVKIDRIISLAPGTLRLPGTPVLLLFDRDQVVRKLWIGRLSTEKEAEVLAAISQ